MMLKSDVPNWKMVISDEHLISGCARGVLLSPIAYQDTNSISIKFLEYRRFCLNSNKFNWVYGKQGFQFLEFHLHWAHDYVPIHLISSL